MLAKGAGGYHFKFFRMGEWVDVVIDDKLPDRHEGKINRAIESKKGEWWVPLVEKAYAKFHGGYNNIVGGETAVALTELSGGIAVDANNLDSTGVNIGDLLKKLQRNSLITTSNRDGAGNETVTKGLVSGHAYSLLLVDTMTLKDGSKLDMVKIRNPQGRGEWDGAWNDDDTEWADVSDDEKKRLGVVNSNDGSFWMELEDWVDEFENLTICALPGLDVNDEDGISEEEKNSRDVRVSGTFPPGVQNETLSGGNNKNPDLSSQIELTVGDYGQTDTRLIWLQILIDSPVKVKRSVLVNFWATTSKSGDDPFNRPQSGTPDFKKLQKVEPVFPNKAGHQPYPYRHNGYLLDVAPGKYLITVSTKLKESTNDPTNFIVRAMGSNLKLRPVTEGFF